MQEYAGYAGSHRLIEHPTYSPIPRARLLNFLYDPALSSRICFCKLLSPSLKPPLTVHRHELQACVAPEPPEGLAAAAERGAMEGLGTRWDLFLSAAQVPAWPVPEDDDEFTQVLKDGKLPFCKLA